MKSNKIKEILEGWMFLILDSMELCPPKIKMMAYDRLRICSQCEIRKGKMCSKKKGGCGCPIPAKIKSPNSQCPKNKW